MQPKEMLFRVGDDSQSGIFIVVEGRLGVYLEEHDSDSLTLTNTLITGESVGDLDVLDGTLVLHCSSTQSVGHDSVIVVKNSGVRFAKGSYSGASVEGSVHCFVHLRQICEALRADAGARRSVTCIAMEEGATLVNVSRDLFMTFIAAKPRTLQIYLHKACSYQNLTAKLAHFNPELQSLFCERNRSLLWVSRC